MGMNFKSSLMRPLAVGVVAALMAFGTSAQAADQWNVNAADSAIAFTGKQLGADFNGAFESFNATIAFSPDDLAASSVEVLIDIASVNTQNGDRDSQIVSADWFNAGEWPTAKFATKSFSEVAPGSYQAVADLTIRDVTKEVTLPFDLVINGNDAEAKGSVTIKRTDFGVGQGQWADVSQVGDDVTINITIKASK